MNRICNPVQTSSRAGRNRIQSSICNLPVVLAHPLAVSIGICCLRESFCCILIFHRAWIMSVVLDRITEE